MEEYGPFVGEQPIAGWGIWDVMGMAKIAARRDRSDLRPQRRVIVHRGGAAGLDFAVEQAEGGGLS